LKYEYSTNIIFACAIAESEIQLSNFFRSAYNIILPIQRYENGLF